MLGAVLIDSDCVNLMTSPKSSSRMISTGESHEKILRAMVPMSEAGAAIDLLTLSDYLQQRNEIETVGGCA